MAKKKSLSQALEDADPVVEETTKVEKTKEVNPVIKEDAPVAKQAKVCPCCGEQTDDKGTVQVCTECFNYASNGSHNPSVKKGSDINSLLDELKQSSIDERQRLILSKYEKALETFKNNLGTKEFLKHLSEYMLEIIEGKIVAARK